MYTLLIVDMQAQFPHSLGKAVQANCKRAIHRAIKDKAPIIFIEYEDYGPTLPCLTSLVENYRKVYYTTKNEWDGSTHSLSIIKSKKLPRTFKVCGVYTDQCVSATVDGLLLRTKRAKIHLLSKACATVTDSDQSRAIKRMRSLPRVRVY